jgi:hypothetical protein
VLAQPASAKTNATMAQAFMMPPSCRHMLRAPLRHVRALALPGIRHHLRMYWRA